MYLVVLVLVISSTSLAYSSIQRMTFSDILMLFLRIHYVPYMALHVMKG